MVKALFGMLIVFLVVIIVLTCVCYWLYNYATLEKLGYADVEIGEIELPDGEMQTVTARDIGIENMTLKELLNWFKNKINK
ncbi:MAG: hypothetical protein K2I23_04125 [Clostridia bacterium]|nr:hypothetical protein [Clostridia bacterium]